MNTKELAEKIKNEINNYEDDMIKFMQDVISIPSESCEEEEVVNRVKEEMEKLGFDEVEIDPMGNLIGKIGNGDRVIAYDAHLDTVGVGDPDEWEWDPFSGKLDNGIIYGRGATD
ncbi:MAG TPA: M20/M25/M40 family metallo-hydrolase, partial [Halanaerobiales bacterium]|nr:M20/M25/M40 family metallo-hydrolase [Halanaerobiales bacterium]